MGRRPVGVYVIPRVDYGIEHIAVDVVRTKSELYELGVRILLVLAKHDRVPDNLAYVFEKHDPETLEKLVDLLVAAR
ncbi:MAG: hypothetical protein GSR84_03460 [Desulfurococcales archaeon]|nr:hypothetical protein [Desulfurococcales archaeon]